MEIGVGLDHTLGMNWDDQANLAREAAELGYESIWTPENIGTDSFQVCARRWQASCDVVAGGLTTGIGVSPVMYRTPVGFAMSGGTIEPADRGQVHYGHRCRERLSPRQPPRFGLPPRVRPEPDAGLPDHRRAAWCGASGCSTGASRSTTTTFAWPFAPRPAPPSISAPSAPRCCGWPASWPTGSASTWCTPAQIAWSRERIAEGAERAGRDPSEVKVVEYIRICVDDDAETARRAFAKNCLGYPLGAAVPTERERQFGYRAHFERMGYTEELAGADAIRARGGDMDAVADAYPSDALLAVGYYGKPDGAAAAFAKLAAGLDVALVRVIAARPEIASTQAVMRACAPDKVRAAS